MNKIACLYARVSTDKQVKQGASLDSQVAMARKWCADNGYEVVGEPFVDAGVSGKRADNRKALLAALDEVCRVQGVLVFYSLSRLARNTREALNIVERLNKAGAGIVSLTEPYANSTGPMGEFMMTIFLGIAQLMRQITAQNTVDTLARLRENGSRQGCVPYGLRRVTRENGKRDEFEPDPAEQAILAEIVNSTESSRKLAARLNAAQMWGRGKKGVRAMWCAGSLNRIRNRQRKG